MKDDEIIKALECCKASDCDECPFYGVKEDCEVELPEEALELINRQKAEVERLKKFLDMSRKVSLARRDRNLKIGELNLKLTAELKIAKAEAIKEFAERLKEKATQIEENAFKGCYVISNANIDNLVKEMVCEQNE